MEQPLRDHVRYLELRLAECETRSELNREQIAAYRGHLSTARESRDIIDYQRTVKRQGIEFAIARAVWMDRYRAMGCIHRALGDPAKCRAAWINHEAGASATDAVDLSGHLIAAKLRAAPIRIAAESSEAAISGLIVALLEWLVERDEYLEPHKRVTVRSLWAMIRAGDPRCTWQRIAQHPPYRHRIPFSDDRMAILGDWLRQAVGAALCDEPAVPVPDASQTADADQDPPARESSGQAPPDHRATRREPDDWVPTASQAALAYHKVHDVLDASDPANATTRAVYERIFEVESRATDGPCFTRMMAESGLYLELARVQWVAQARTAIAHARRWAQPHVVAHHQQVIDLLERSSSESEIEYEIARHAEYLAVEYGWHDIVLRCATMPITAALFYDLDPDESRRQAVIASRDIACQLFGMSIGALMRAPPVSQLLTGLLGPYHASSDPDIAGPGVAAGEVGTAIGPVLRDLMRRRAEHGRPALATPSELCAQVIEIIETLTDGPVPGEDPASRPSLQLWGEPVRIQELTVIDLASLRPVPVDLERPFAEPADTVKVRGMP